MYNLIVLGTKPSAWTHEQFIDWWRGEHAEPTYKLPGLLRWQHTDLQETFDDKSAGWDGLSVLSFESPEALKAALASPEWKEAVSNVGDMGGRRMIWYGSEQTMVPLTTPMTITWSDPGCFPVAEGVHRIPLQMPGDGLRAINVYALETDSGLALIDGGWRRETTYGEISAALAKIGQTADAIHDIYVTHVHRDHYTFAVELRRRHGCRIHLGSAEVVGIDAIARLGSNVPESSLRELNRAGAHLIAEQAYKDSGGEPFVAADWERPDSWLAEGPLDLPGHNLVAIHTPGHTKGHMVFHDLDRGVSYTGDHVLPTITPSIGFELGDWDLPLDKYLRSLNLMLDDSDRIMLPSHGDPGSGVHARVRELIAHHQRRFAATMAAVEGLGSGTGLSVAQALTWTRRERPFDTLDNFNQMVATCETLAHLDVLADRGKLMVDNQDRVDVFTVR